jgi:MFS family permease
MAAMMVAVLFESHGSGERAPKSAGLLRAWAIASSVYVLAVFHRSSLGVAGLQAEHRFGISAGQLSSFVILQLGVYAAMQIPTGVLVDRFGPRRLLVVAASLMGFAQLLFALAPSYPVALFARALLGCGDALTFVSVLRFSASRFPPNRYPVVVSVTAMLGVAGNIIATVPLSAALNHFGWTPSFGLAGAVSLGCGALVWAALPGGDPPSPGRPTMAQLRGQVERVGLRITASWSHPGTRLGFWLHFGTMSTPTAFGVLWGYPYLVDGLGFRKAAASSTLLLSVVTALGASLAIGWLTGRRPIIRVPLAFSIALITIGGWIAVLAVDPASVPHGLVVLLVAFMTIGGPASSIAFALARDYNPPGVVGTATGVVNVGGFTAAIVISLVIGLILDAVGSTPQGYREAMLTLVVVQAFGAVQILRWWLRTRATAIISLNQGEVIPVGVTRHRWDRVVGQHPN